jgi:hypothetical protein
VRQLGGVACCEREDGDVSLPWPTAAARNALFRVGRRAVGNSPVAGVGHVHERHGLLLQIPAQPTGRGKDTVGVNLLLEPPSAKPAGSRCTCDPAKYAVFALGRVLAPTVRTSPKELASWLRGVPRCRLCLTRYPDDRPVATTPNSICCQAAPGGTQVRQKSVIRPPNQNSRTRNPVTLIAWCV